MTLVRTAPADDGADRLDIHGCFPTDGAKFELFFPGKPLGSVPYYILQPMPFLREEF